MKPGAGRRWALACAVATGLLWLAFRSVEWGRVGDAVGSAGKAWIGLALLLNFSILLLWTAQWWLFVRARRGAGARTGFGRVFGVVAVMSTVANSVPFLAGQAAGVHLLATRAGTGHAAALGVLALDQLAEGLAKLAVLLLLAAAAPLPAGGREAALALGTGVALLAVGVWAGLRLGRGPRFGGRLGRVVRRLGSGFASGLEAARRPGTLAAGLGLALAMKAAEGGAIFAVQRALGVEAPLWATLLVLASVGLATMVAVAPANLGVYEAAAFGAYRLVGVEAETAAALAIVQHALFLLPAAGTGWLVVARSGEIPWKRAGSKDALATLSAGD